MVRLSAVRACNSNLVRAQPLVAVFVGGTSGIGEQTILALSAVHSSEGKGLRLYVVGRNADAGRKIISECNRVCPGGQFRFVQAENLALLQDVDKVCAEIIRIEKQDETADGKTARVDLLVMSQAFLNFQPRKETKEGIDTDMSLLYYSRMRFITQLLPLLLAAPVPAHVISIYAAGMESKLFPSDLSLREPGHYTFANCRSHAVYMKTLFMEAMAERHPGRLSLVHVFPSLVITEGFDKSWPKWASLLFRWLVAPVIRPFSVAPAESGARMLFLAGPKFPARQETGTVKLAEASATEEGGEIAMGTDGTRGSGAYAVNWDGETIPMKKTYNAYKDFRGEGLAGKVWDHTMSAFDASESGTVFAG